MSAEYFKVHTNPKGEFVRKQSSFRNWITKDGSSGFKAESGRYHLYVSYACPWANRTLIVRKMKGLEDCISVDVVQHFLGAKGWSFNPEVEGATEDTVNGCTYISEVYFKANGDYQVCIIHNSRSALLTKFNAWLALCLYNIVCGLGK